jgi:hypothetical protein
MDSCLEKLKKDYEKLRVKYKLPGFSELNIDFEIEKVQERETDLLLRQVRRTMVEKVAVVIRFLEIIVNPAEGQAPLYVFSVIKNVTPEMKRIIERVYRELTVIELGSLSLDIDYDEKNEAKFVKDISEKWPIIKKDLKEITKKLGIVWTHEKMHDNYFG